MINRPGSVITDVIPLGGFVKFSLATLLVAFIAIAISLGWLIDRNSREHDIVGAWINSEAMLGYSSQLDIRPDGTFNKTQSYRWGNETFSGLYSALDNGKFVFNVTRVVSDSSNTSKTATVDATYICRCGIDPVGVLVITAIEDSPIISPNKMAGIQWDCHMKKER